MEQAWEQNDLLVHQTIVWSKTRGVLTRSHFLWKHEQCFYGWRKGMHPEKDRRPPPSETTIWELESENDRIHPTQKPTEVFARPISWHTFEGEVVLEPFSGSGTQIIAAEKLRRRCRAMELSPAFVDVAVKRWMAATGGTATLEDGRTWADAEQERASIDQDRTSLAPAQQTEEQADGS
jgi:DNA modification methylase